MKPKYIIAECCMMEVIPQCFRCFYVFFIILKYGSSAEVVDAIY